MFLKNKKLIIMIVSTLVFTNSLFISCGNSEEFVNSEQKIVFNLGGNITNIDPSLNETNEESTLSINLFEGLMSYDKDNNLVPGVAKDYKISDDGLTYTFNLKENAKWSNGEKLLAKDFKYSWIRTLKEGSSLKENLFYIKNSKKFLEGKVSEDEIGIKVIDDNILEITLEAVTPSFLALTTSSIYMPLYEKSIELKDDWLINPETYVSNGPFKLKEFNLNHEIILEKNYKYTKVNDVKLQEVVFNLLNDDDLAYSGLNSGKYDIINTISINKFEDAENKNLLHDFDVLKSYCIEINTNNPKMEKEVKEFLSNKKVREALTISINRESIADSLGSPAYSYVPSNIEKLNNSDFNNKSYFTDNNINKAKSLLKEAGYGRDSKPIPTIELVYYGGTEDEYILNILKEDWSKIGFDISLNKLDRDEYLRVRKIKEYDLIKFNWTADYPGVSSFLKIWHSSGFYNNGSFKNNEFDKLMDNAIVESNLEKRNEMFKKAEDILMDEKFIIPIYFPKEHLGINENLENITVLPMGEVYFQHAYVK